MGSFKTAVMLNYNFEKLEEEKLWESMERIALSDIQGLAKVGLQLHCDILLS